MQHLDAFLIKFGLFLTTWRGFEIWVIRREGDSTCGDPIGCTLQAYLIGVHLISLYLTGVYLTGVHLTGVHLTGMSLTGVHLIGIPCTGDTSSSWPHPLNFGPIYGGLAPKL